MGPQLDHNHARIGILKLAQPPTREPDLLIMIVVTTVTQTCCASPNIYCGITREGEMIFARYRWGHLSVRILPAGIDDGAEGATGKSILEVDHGERFDGYIYYHELRSLTEEIIEWPETCG